MNRNTLVCLKKFPYISIFTSGSIYHSLPSSSRPSGPIPVIIPLVGIFLLLISPTMTSNNSKSSVACQHTESLRPNIPHFKKKNKIWCTYKLTTVTAEHYPCNSLAACDYLGSWKSIKFIKGFRYIYAAFRECNLARLMYMINMFNTRNKTITFTPYFFYAPALGPSQFLWSSIRWSEFKTACGCGREIAIDGRDIAP